MNLGRILIVDDNTSYLRALSDACSAAGYEVHLAADGFQALEAAREAPPDAILLDIMMPRLDGYATCREFRLDPMTAEVPILMLSALGEPEDIKKGFYHGADDFKVKPPDGEFLKTGDINELLARLWQAIVRYRLRPQSRVILELEWGPGAIRYSVQGAMTSGGSLVVSADGNRWGREMAALADAVYEYHEGWLRARRRKDSEEERRYLERREAWRLQSADKGRDLFRDVFENNATLLEDWGRAQQSAGASEERLVIRFSGAADALIFPFELLHVGTRPLAIRHPITRQIVTTRANRPSWRNLIQGRKGRSLRALLMAGEEFAVKEVQTVAADLRRALALVGIGLEVEPENLSHSVTLEEGEALLQKRTFDLVHYAGHARFDRGRPENSALAFGGDGAEELRASRLAGLLAGSPTQLLFLSCCSGAEIRLINEAAGSSYLGLIDAAVQAGVPAVFGYRWPVVGRSARHFAHHFYEGLGRFPASLEYAAWWARKQIFETSAAGGWDETWFSPMLVVQNPDSSG
ncbi:MAG TPA: CHAT domain-containing protein [Thermoanaerobaculia bacterium]|nr:CHAT domain-containing protein [Thermoanaerobaculia bacterium]